MRVRVYSTRYLRSGEILAVRAGMNWGNFTLRRGMLSDEVFRDAIYLEFIFSVCDVSESDISGSDVSGE